MVPSSPQMGILTWAMNVSPKGQDHTFVNQTSVRVPQRLGSAGTCCKGPTFNNHPAPCTPTHTHTQSSSVKLRLHLSVAAKAELGGSYKPHPLLEVLSLTQRFLWPLGSWKPMKGPPALRPPLSHLNSSRPSPPFPSLA